MAVLQLLGCFHSSSSDFFDDFLAVAQKDNPIEFDQLTGDHRPFLLHEEEKELAMRPILRWHISTHGDCAQTHAVPKKGQTPSNISVSDIFGTVPEPSRPQTIDGHCHGKTRANNQF